MRELHLHDGRDPVSGALAVLEIVGLLVSACWRSGGSMEIKMAALIFSRSISLKSRDSAKTSASHLSMWVAALLESLRCCHHKLHAPHGRRGAVPLGELSPRFESTEYASVRHLECSALDQGPEDIEDPGHSGTWSV